MRSSKKSSGSSSASSALSVDAVGALEDGVGAAERFALFFLQRGFERVASAFRGGHHLALGQPGVLRAFRRLPRTAPTLCGHRADGSGGRVASSFDRLLKHDGNGWLRWSHG